MNTVVDYMKSVMPAALMGSGNDDPHPEQVESGNDDHTPIGGDMEQRPVADDRRPARNQPTTDRDDLRAQLMERREDAVQLRSLTKEEMKELKGEGFRQASLRQHALDMPEPRPRHMPAMPRRYRTNMRE